MNKFDAAHRALFHAEYVKKWSTPIQGFGWVIAIFAAIAMAFAVLLALWNLFSRSGETAVYPVAGAIFVAAAVYLVQACVILLIASYAKMRAEAVIFEMTAALYDQQ